MPLDSETTSIFPIVFATWAIKTIATPTDKIVVAIPLIFVRPFLVVNPIDSISSAMISPNIDTTVTPLINVHGSVSPIDFAT